ncbi:type VI secretion system tube protein Hcp [Pleionea sediminis]|uniref:type VI secretion system tube protein Hcp n=1 Tax=Pleionea sediminis TaxID=2569479 RepID=UPI001184FA24|nr:type VI secretion system tube protein Hcp [Pleionea sediminis]
MKSNSNNIMLSVWDADGTPLGSYSDSTKGLPVIDFQFKTSLLDDGGSNDFNDKYSPCVIVTEQGPHTPMMLQQYAEGKDIKKVEIKFYTRIGGKKENYKTWTFENVKVVELELNDFDGDMETGTQVLSFNFSKVEMTCLNKMFNDKDYDSRK